MQPSLVINPGTSTGQVVQPGIVTVPMTVSSSMSGSIPNMMTLNKPGGQNVVVTSQNLCAGQPGAMLPNVQILNMRPGASAVAAQKSVAAVSPRVVIGAPQVVGTRPSAPGITLQTLQSLQPGQQGHLLLKTENGQYQLLRVGPASGLSVSTGQLMTPPSQTIRLSTVPAHPGVATVTTSMAAPAPATSAAIAPAPLPQQHYQSQQPPPAVSGTTYVKPSDNTKEKCRNFLANLLDLSSKEPPSVEMNVRNLIQELIDAMVEPEEFCNRLERLLNASPQPCLIGFLKKSLPLLRQSLVLQELVIEGINPPAPHVAFPNIPPTAPPVVMATSSHQMKPVPKPGSTIAVLQNIPVHTKINVNKVGGGKGAAATKASMQRGTASALATVLAPGKSLLKDKERKSSSQFTAQPFSDEKMAGDDDINDVAAMGGVNLAEETQRILGSTEMIGTQIRSCKEEYLVPMSAMQARVKAIVASNGLEEASPEVASLLIHAVHERLKTLIEKLAVIAQQRIDFVVKNDDRYEATQDVKGQLKFLEEVDRVEKKRREETEREVLMRAAKSRSKNEDPEQAKLKAKAKEMQRVEMEEIRQRDANLTALQAIGSRKRPRLEGATDALTAASTAGTSQNSTGRSQVAACSRQKRISQRDMLFLLETDRDTAHSLLLYKSYLK